jgi:4-hydroxy 2-oxovalerate aldolase
MSQQKRPLILDCTLRDGGYYNDWDFSLDEAREIVAALGKAGVDIIEIGYRSTDETQFYGAFKYCSEDVMRSIVAGVDAAFAFMIDAKEFAPTGMVDLAALRARVPPRDESIFSWCRIAAHPNALAPAVAMAAELKQRGYAVGLNIMGISALEPAALKAAVDEVAGADIDVLYLADSYGSLTPEMVREKIDALRAGFPGKVGVHMHENLGLALANTLAAVDHGADFVDVTLAGMGRGAGNARTEQLLLALFARGGRKDLDPSTLLPVLREHMAPLQRRFGWGWDFNYMLSGLVGIHPMYCQELKAGARYDLEEVARILEGIPSSRRARFDEAELLAAEARFAERKRNDVGEVENVSPWVPQRALEEVLVVAGGPSAAAHKDGLLRYIERRRPLVVACNDVPFLDGVERVIVVLNSVRAHELAARGALDAKSTLVTPLRSLPGSLKSARVQRVEHILRRGSFGVGDGIVLPGFNVGMLAVAMALQCNPKRITIAGFDGFGKGVPEHEEMATFFELVRGQTSIEITSLLPTRYELATRSPFSV